MIPIFRPICLLNAVGSGFNYQTEEPTNQPQRQDLYRGDWNITDSWRANGKYIFYKNSPIQPYGSFVLGTNLPDYATIFPNNRYGVSATVTGSLNPTTVLEVTFGQTHNFIDILPNNPNFNRAGLNLTGIPLLYPGAVQIDLPPQFVFNGGRIANGPNIGSNNAPFYNFNTTRDWSASLSKIWGAHNLKFGWFWQNSFKPQSSFANNNGQYNFVNDANNPLDTGFGFANAVTGQPYNVGFTIPGLSAYTLTGTQNVEGARIVLLKDPGSGNSGDPYRQFDVSAFTTPQPGSLGFESGRNFLYRAPINSWDLSLSKRFRVKETAEFEIRLDAFNALNHTQFDAVNTTLNVTSLTNSTPTNLGSESTRSLWAGFGAITSVHPPRNLQLSARFQF